MALTKTSMQNFDAVWAEPTVAKFGLDGDALQNFASQMIQDLGYRAEMQEKLVKLFNARQTNESGVLLGPEALAFIQEAFAELTDQELTMELS